MVIKSSLVQLQPAKIDQSKPLYKPNLLTIGMIYQHRLLSC